MSRGHPTIGFDQETDLKKAPHARHDTTTSKVADPQGEGVALIADLKQMIAEKLASQADKSATCPHCGCPEFTRHECDGVYQTTRRDYVSMPTAFPKYWEQAT